MKIKSTLSESQLKDILEKHILEKHENDKYILKSKVREWIDGIGNWNGYTRALRELRKILNNGGKDE